MMGTSESYKSKKFGSMLPIDYGDKFQDNVGF